MTTPTPAALEAAEKIFQFYGPIGHDREECVAYIAKQIDSALAAERARVAGLLLRSKRLADFMANDYEDGGTEETARKLSADIHTTLAAMETK